MKVVRHDGADERHAIVALILDTGVLSRVSGSLGESPFSSKWANLVARWCCQHYEKYQQAPGLSGIQAIFDSWKERPDDDTVSLVAEFLSNLPVDMEMSTEYALDLIAKTTQKAALKRLGQGLVSLCDSGRYDDAQAFYDTWHRPSISNDSEGVFPLQDESCIVDAFMQSQADPLIEYPGDLGQFINPVLVRDSFVAFLAPEKTGKTTTLTDLAWRGVESGRRVALFSMGDMSQGQMLMRLSPRLCKKPIKGGPFSIPISLEYKDREHDVKKKKYHGTQVSVEEVKAAWAAHRGDAPDRFRLLTYPAGTLSAYDIASRVTRWASEGWVPDIIVIDYADILDGPPGVKENIEKIDANWKRLRALSTEMRALVVTATQSTRDGYSSWLLSKKDVSDCKKKVAHVTAMIGLNMTEEERRVGVCRYNYVALREAEFMEEKPICVGVAGCTKVGRPSLISAWVT